MKIKSIKRYTFEHAMLKFGEGTNYEQEYLSLISLYDEKSNLVEEQKLNTENETEEVNTFIYNEQGKLLEHKMSIVADGFTETYKNHRDETGRLIKEEKLYGDESGEATVYVYDDKGQVIEIHKTDEEGVATTKEIISYNDRGNIIKRTLYDSNETVIESTALTYDEKENIVSKSEYDGNNNLLNISEYTYNDKNEIERVIQKNTQGKLTESIAYAYDEHGNLLEKNIRDFHPRKLKFKYDEKGHCLEEEMYDQYDNLSSKSIYEFDEHGNVVSEINYNMDINRMNRDSNSGHRFEYEFYTD